MKAKILTFKFATATAAMIQRAADVGDIALTSEATLGAATVSPKSFRPKHREMLTGLLEAKGFTGVTLSANDRALETLTLN